MIKKSEFVWNTIGSCISSVLNAILLLFCTRINGTEVAGMFSIGFATAIILNAIGDFGIRIYQVTDIKRKYKFNDYLLARITVVIFMFLIGLIFVVLSGYTPEKMLICILLIIFKIVDNLSETYQAEFQINSRLDIGGKSIVIRNCFALILFLLVDIITHNIIYSCIALVIGNIIFFLLYDKIKIKKFVTANKMFDKQAIKNIIKECLPLGISTLLSMYITNAIKYAIDINGNYEMQTYFNIIYLPTFTINLISLLVIKPILKPLGDYWNENDKSSFIKVVLKLIAIVFAATIVIEILSAIIVIPILSMLYGVDLSMYKLELMILVLSGLFYAISTIIFYALSTMRKQKQTTVAYIVTSIFSLIVPYILVRKFEMMGAAISNLLITLVLFIMLTIFFISAYKKEGSQ